jgi:hypothetical protein
MESPMTHFFLLSLLATLARALLAGGCGEVLRLFLQYLAPGIPPLAGIAIGLVLGVTVVEIAAALWHRGAGSNEDP